MAAESSWWPLSAWLSTGAAWFLFFNVIVGVVVVLSWGQGGDATLSRRKRLTRSASSMVMERLRSVSFFSFHTATDYGSITAPASELHHVQEYCTFQEEEAEEMRQAMRKVEPEPTVAVGESRTPTMAPVETAAVRAAAWTTGSEEAAKTETTEEMPVSLELDESCAVARRRQALALQPPPAAAAAAAAAEAVATVVKRPRKREPAKVVEIAERRAYAEVEEKAEVNARAERFIRQFREDLKLERLNSILNYRRCAGAAPAR